jgi:hypothetical protein
MVTFFYSPCGHPFACDGTSADLHAKQVSLATAGFERDLGNAIKTGKYLYRSSCPYGSLVRDAVYQVAREFPYATTLSIDNAKAALQDWLDWLQAD